MPDFFSGEGRKDQQTARLLPRNQEPVPEETKKRKRADPFQSLRTSSAWADKRKEGKSSWPDKTQGKQKWRHLRENEGKGRRKKNT